MTVAHRLASRLQAELRTGDVVVHETHISWVVLAGSWAYKIKKPVQLDFLDFSTLDARHQSCIDEVELNRRFSPELYDGVVGIYGSPDTPSLTESGAPFEFAVRMRRFPDDQRLDHVLACGELRPDHLQTLAADLAGYQDQAPPLTSHEHGSHERVRSQLLDALASTRDTLGDAYAASVGRLRTWCAHTLTHAARTISGRRTEGRVRDGHGDLHLANLVLLDDRIRLFDCLEFSPELRCVDVASEVAFLAMDLDSRARPDLGHHFINAWLENTGDYGALAVLRLYKVYRALVRARVAGVRSGQSTPESAEQIALRDECAAYLELATGYTRGFDTTPLIITCGLSGSGKSHLAAAVARLSGAVRLRSDTERRRLFPRDDADGVDTGRYASMATERTYTRLANLCRIVLRAGYPVIVDAAFLRRADRHLFRNLASTLNVPFRILHTTAPDDVLERRVAAKAHDPRDPSEATLEVLSRQRVVGSPPGADERAVTIEVDSDGEVDVRALTRRLLRRHLAAPAGESRPPTR